MSRQGVTMHDGTVYLSCAETARLVRAALRRAFPMTQFSVRSSVYAGGASIDVRWTDGPRRDRVEEITKKFEGAAFDGMVDLKTSRAHYLAPGGEPILAHAEGTEGSGGTIPGVSTPSAPPHAQRVRFGADFVFCSREVTALEERMAKAAALIRERCDTTGTPPRDLFGSDVVTDLARRMVYALHFPEFGLDALDTEGGLTTLEDAFREVIYGEKEEEGT